MTKYIYGVIGANYGDEGKGRTVDALCRKHEGSKIVVCTNGSAQRGHTVVDRDKRHVFHHFGSGTIAKADTYFAKDFIVNPYIFEQEEQELRRDGIVTTQCFANRQCRVTFVYDMMANQIIELSRTDKHGSCGCGVWETLVRCDNGLHYTIWQLVKFSDDMLYNVLRQCRDYSRQRVLSVLAEEHLSERIYKEYEPLFASEKLLSASVNSIRHFLNTVTLVSDSSFLRHYTTVVFENGQGLLLDYRVDERLSTPSITGAEAIAAVFNDGFATTNANVCLYYVTRTYITRHGSADFKEKCDVSEINPAIFDETNAPNLYQGTLMFGKLNYTELYQRVEADAKLIGVDAEFGLAVTHTDEYPWQGEMCPVGTRWMIFS